MDGKTIAIIAVAAVVVLAGAGAAGILLMKDDKGKSSDYTLLDRDTAEEGLYYSITSEIGEMTTVDSSKITHVYEDGTLDVSNREETNGSVTMEMNISYFTTEFFDVDGEAPSGVTVTKQVVDGNLKYTIDGKSYSETKGEYYNTESTMEFKSVEFVIGPTSKILSASGEAIKEYSRTHVESPDSIYEKDHQVWKLSTKDGAGMVDADVDYDEKYLTKVDSYADFKGRFEIYSAVIFSGCTITSEAARYGGVDCTKYVINGTSTYTLDEYKDMEIYVYGAYIISSEGSLNGDHMTETVEIYID